MNRRRSHRAVWNAGPAKLSSPGIGGTVGTDSWPHAVSSTFAWWVPAVVSSTHVSRDSSQRALSTSVLVRMRSRTPYRLAISSRYAWISACGA